MKKKFTLSEGFQNLILEAQATSIILRPTYMTPMFLAVAYISIITIK